MTAILSNTQRRTLLGTELPGTWDPLAEQHAESDTLWMPDLTDMASINASGGFLGTGSNEAQNPVHFTFGAGKYGPSVKPLGTGTYTNFVFWPIDGLLSSDQFTFECNFMHPTLAWQDVSLKMLFVLRGTNFSLPFFIYQGGIYGSFETWMGAPASHVQKDITKQFSLVPEISLPAAVWHNVALTYLGTTAKIYFNGTLFQTVTGLVLPPVLTDTLDGISGIVLGGYEQGPSGFAFSDPRTSRTVRTPGGAI